MTTTTRDISKLVTIVFLARNTFDMTEKVLERIVECTPQSVPMIVTDTGAPPAERAWMENFCARNAHLLLRSKTYTTPPQIRNAALDHVKTKYVCFIDNDVLVTPGWLDALVNCAEETGAWVVGPLICERMPELTYVHGYDGDLEIRETEDGARVYHDFHYNAHVRLADIEKDLVRKPTPIVEFHLQLIAMKVFEDVGRYDEEIVNMYEYADLFLRFKTKDKIYLEPQSRVTYLPPRNIRRQDRWFFELRWSEAWTDLTEQKFAANHRLTARHPQAKPPHNFVRSQRMWGKNWLRAPRRWFGRPAIRKLERRYFVPIETIWNRWKYPKSIYGKIKPLELEVIRNQPGE